jgi:hypothetical protein
MEPGAKGAGRKAQGNCGNGETDGSPPDKANQVNSMAGLCTSQMNAVDVTEWETRRAGEAESEIRMLKKRNLLIL